ncbi:hypothetical protein K438DRAFT_2000832 [Mycena galopus ATCC 62051]|nr:hypothetical protein K438DRAFT_2000832 [Mycena galopus ATCC 62051]
MRPGRPRGSFHVYGKGPEDPPMEHDRVEELLHVVRRAPFSSSSLSPSPSRSSEIELRSRSPPPNTRFSCVPNTPTRPLSLRAPANAASRSCSCVQLPLRCIHVLTLALKRKCLFERAQNARTHRRVRERSSYDYDSIIERNTLTLWRIHSSRRPATLMPSDAVFGYDDHNDDTMISMLGGGGHVHRRSIGAGFKASFCVRVEKRKHNAFQTTTRPPARLTSSSSLLSH